MSHRSNAGTFVKQMTDVLRNKRHAMCGSTEILVNEEGRTTWRTNCRRPREMGIARGECYGPQKVSWRLRGLGIASQGRRTDSYWELLPNRTVTADGDNNKYLHGTTSVQDLSVVCDSRWGWWEEKATCLSSKNRCERSSKWIDQHGCA